MLLRQALLLFYIAIHVNAKVYDRCQLAHELKYVYKFPGYELPTWICIVSHESIYDTAAMNPGSGDHGLFQISQLFWCSPPGDGFGCNSPCDKFRDDDIADDVQCVKRIFKEHTRISGDGFNAWAVYPLYCKGDTSRYIRGCFENDTDVNLGMEEEMPQSTEEPFDEDDDGYDFPPLPSPPTKKTPDNVVSSDEDFYEFPPLPTTSPKSIPIILSRNLELESLMTLSLVDVTVTEPEIPTTSTTKLIDSSSSFTVTHEELSSSVTPVTQSSSRHAADMEEVTTLKPVLKTSSNKFEASIVDITNITTSTYPTKKKQFITTQPTSFMSHATAKPKQLTYKPFTENPEIVFTLPPALGLPRPPNIRPPSTRPPSIRPPSIRPPSLKPPSRPFNNKPLSNQSLTSGPFSNIRPPINFSRPPLRPHIMASSSISTSTTPEVYSQKSTTGAGEKQKFYSTTRPSTFQKAPKKLVKETTVPSTTTTKGSQSLSFKFDRPKKFSLNPFKSTTTPKPLSNNSNRNTLKREEQKYDNVFPGYLFSRIGNGFKLILVM